MPHTVSGPTWPEATAHGVRRPATCGRSKGWLDLSLAARSGGEAACSAGMTRVRRARSSTAWWRLADGEVLLVSLRGPQGWRRARRSGWSSPERRRDGEAVEDASSGGVHRRVGSSVGRRRWRHNPEKLVRKREGEGCLKWGQRWRIEGSHREATEAVALGREPERRRDLRWREPARGRISGDEGVELELRRRTERSEVSASSPNRRACGEE
jgi:hypothetical protein